MFTLVTRSPPKSCVDTNVGSRYVVVVPATEVERPLTPAQVAAMLSVTSTTVYRWARAGRLPHFRTPGNQMRFRREDVEALMATDEGAA